MGQEEGGDRGGSGPRGGIGSSGTDQIPCLFLGLKAQQEVSRTCTNNCTGTDPSSLIVQARGFPGVNAPSRRGYL